MFKPEIKSDIGEDISILLQLDNHSQSYICECGDARKLTVKDCQNTDVIFISHTHIDHFINFDTILRHQIGGNRKVIVCGPEGISHQLQAKIKGYTWNLIEENAIVYEIREIINAHLIRQYEVQPPHWTLKEIGVMDENTIYRNERFKVNFTILDHKIPSIAYLFKEEDSVNIDLTKATFKGGTWVKDLKLAFKNNDELATILVGNKAFIAKELFYLMTIKVGNSVGIIMDHAANTANHDKIKALFSHCDKAFIECFYKADDKAFAEQNYHSYSEQSGKIMRESQVKEAIPVHFSRKYNEEQIREVIEEFEKEFRKIPPSV